MIGPEGDDPVEWVDENDRVIEVVPRSRMRAENLRHRSAAVVVQSSDGRLLVHRRAATKDLFPGWWDVCAGGVVAVGERFDETARRELAEELGIVADELELLGRGTWDDDASTEITEIYRILHDGPFAFSDGEVVEARFVAATELAVLMRRERFLPSCAGFVLPLIDGFDT